VVTYSKSKPVALLILAASKSKLTSILVSLATPVFAYVIFES